jgi:hypothetical protein
MVDETDRNITICFQSREEEAGAGCKRSRSSIELSMSLYKMSN